MRRSAAEQHTPHFFHSATSFFFLLFSFHLLTTQLTLQNVTLILIGENLPTTLPHIIPFSYRPTNVGSVRSTIRDSCWTMGSTPSHMATKISERRWRVYGRVRSCILCRRMRPRARVCMTHTHSIPTRYNHPRQRRHSGTAEGRSH